MIAWEALTSFLSRYWTYILTAIIVVAILAVVYWQGGAPYRAQLAKEHAEQEAAKIKAEAADASDQDQSKGLVDRLNKEHADEKARLNRTWADIVAGMQRSGDQPPARQPVQVSAGICQDATRNQRLSDSISIYLGEVRAAIDAERAANRRVIADERKETAGLLEVAESQAVDLETTQEWVAEETKIWETPGPIPFGSGPR